MVEVGKIVEKVMEFTRNNPIPHGTARYDRRGFIF